MAGWEQDFAAALARLQGSGAYNPIPQARPMRLTPPDFSSYTPVDPNVGIIPLSAYGAGAETTDGKPWWATPLEKLSTIATTIQGISGIPMNQIANWTNGQWSWAEDFPLADTVADFSRGVAKPFQDGFQLKDVWAAVPFNGILRGLEEAGKDAKTSRDVMDNRGLLLESPADPTKGWDFFDRRANNLDYADALSFVLDAVSDPLTWITFGGASAIKSGAGAAAREGATQLASAGIKKALPRAVRNDAGKIAEFVAKEIGATGGEQAGTAARIAVENAAKNARNISQNAALSLDVPFTRYTKPLIMKGKNSIFRVTDSVIGQNGANAVRRILTDTGITDADDQVQLLKRVYGVDDPAKMTSQMLEHLTQNVGRVKQGEDIVEVFRPVTDELFTYNHFTPDDILNTISDPNERNYVRNLYGNLDRTFTTPQILGDYRTLLNDLGSVRGTMPRALANRADELLEFASQAPGMVNQDDILRSIDDLLQAGDAFRSAEHTADTSFVPFQRAMDAIPSSARTLENATDVFDLRKFAQDMGGSSRASRFLSDRMFRAVNARTAGSADPFINDAVSRIRDAETQVHGNLTQMGRDMRQFEKLAQGLTKEEVNKIPYIIEGKAPGGQTMEQFLSGVSNKEKLYQLADYTKQMLARTADREQRAGALKNMIENYYPHVVTKNGMSKEQIESILTDPVAQRYLGRDAVNQFDQSRKGPDSFAAWDDMISKLEDALESAPDEELPKIEKKLEQINGLFERDVTKALSSRYRESIYSTAFTELYSDLHNMGLIVTADDLVKTGRKPPGRDFVPIDTALKKKLNVKGVDEGGYIHRELLENLEKVQNLFTTESANKFFEVAQSAVNIFRSLVTTPILGHHLNNLIGNMANNAMAGVGITDYTRAGNLLRKLKAGKLSSAEERLIQEAYDKGVLASGMLYDVADPFRQAKAENLGWIGKLERKIVDNPLGIGRMMRNTIGDNVEDFTRLALYLKGKRSGLSAKQAATQVRKYLFSYGEHTQLERGIRIAVPFWNWTKNNLSLQIMEFARQPRYYSVYRHFQRMLDDESNSAKPPWVGDYLKIPGTDKYVNPRLPMSDLTSITEDPMLYLANQFGPIPKIIFELGMNRQVFNDRPIDPNKTDYNNYDILALLDYAISQTGLPGRLMSAYDSKDPLSSYMRIALPMWPQTVDQRKTIQAKRQQLKAERKQQVQK